MPNPPYQKPVVSYPVPVITDLVLVELFNTEIADYKPIQPGTPHENTRDYPGFKLGSQQAIPGNDKIIRRVWVTDAVNQDLYNYALKYAEQSAAHHIFIRAYRELKSTYAERVRGSALQVVFKLKKVLAGSGYNPVLETLPLTFSGGGGSGAAGLAIIAADGTISELVLTSGGSGYTSAPTFTVPAPVSGITATGTAYIQATTALLVEEEALQYPMESEYFSLYFNVIRVYETLPGPELMKPSIDPETGALMKTYTQRVSLPGTMRVLDAEYPASSAYYVIDSFIAPESSVVGTLVTVTMKLPDPRTEYQSIGFQFPAIFNFIVGWAVPSKFSPSDANWPIQPPIPGVNFTLTAHVTASKPAEVVTYYTRGLVPSPAPTWQVTTPGRADRLGFGIGDNTIHNAIFLDQSDGVDTVTAEDLPASTPASYTPGDTLDIQFSSKRWKGNFFESKLVSVTEDI